MRALGMFVCAAVLCGPVSAQTGNPVTVVVLDGKSGKPVTPSNYVVRFDRHDAVHNDGLRLNDDGSAQLALPDGTAWLAVEATYDSSMETYINCDAAREKEKGTVHWYAVADILKSGIVAPNECGKSHLNARPGVFVFFVRKRDWRDSPIN